MKIDKIKKSEQPGCVVGIGSSAGGLEALQQFLTFLPADTGMAFVVIQHLSPDHRSLLADILGKYTTMPVMEAQDGMHVRKNTVYILPPKYNMEIEGGVLHLHEYNHQHINHPIDVFFRSLAKSYENRAVAMILSGTGSDGTNGIRSIKERNGMIIAQSPESAKFDGMPRSAIATGFVDLILNPDSIAREMAHISRSMADAGQRLQLSDGDLLSQVFSILKNVTNVNYSYYKQTTVLRRIERRIVVTHNRNLREYVNYMSNNPEEARLLAKEVLIGVTSFFRDQDYFDILKERVVKDLLRNARPSDQIRIWVAGCSTGEEAYSIAILFAEAMEEMGIRRDIKIFATDLDGDSIAVAGRGVYGDSIQEDVSVTRLSRFFTKKGNRYTVNHDIRKMIVFAQHNVFQDPPFGRLDLVSCRNLLIYFQSILQRNLFAIFHMALNDGGYLFLGRSESVIDYDDVFRVLCPNEKIFVHNSSGRTPSHEHITYSMQGVENNMDSAGILHNVPEPELTFNSGASGIQENLQHIYSTPYNYMPDGVRYYGSFEKEQKVPHVSLLLYHVAAKVDINWFVDEEKRSKTNMLRLTKMDACNLFNGNAFCFKPMENSLPALPTTTDSVHIVTRTDEGLWWEGRSYFYTIPYTTTGKTGYYPLQMQMETNESGAIYKPTVYLGVNTSSPFVPWLRATFNINNPLAAGTAEKTVSL